MITDDEIESALDYLRHSAPAIGLAKERMVKAGHMIKHVKALEMKRQNERAVSAQEREAFASKAFMDALIEDAAAAGAYEVMKSLREAAAAKIDAWRTQQSSYRAMGRLESAKPNEFSVG